MKSALPSLLLLTLASGSASAATAVQVETRAFHSYLRLDLKEAVHTIHDQVVATQDGGSSYQNTAGGGIAFVGRLDDALSLGLGYERARYYPGPDSTLDQQSLSLFTRWNLYQGDSSQLHFLAGLSQHRLTGEADASVDITYTPVMNYDFGLGHTWTFGLWNVGLAYKYSDTFGRGNSRAVLRTRTVDELSLTEVEVKSRLRNFNIEQQTLSLNVGVNL